VCEALVRSGLTDPLGPLARALVAVQRLTGPVKLADGSDGTVAWCTRAGPLLATAATGWVEDLLGPVAKAVHRLGRGEGTADGFLTRSAVDALGRVAPSLRVIGQPDVADEAERVAVELSAAVELRRPDRTGRWSSCSPWRAWAARAR
jgi:hypothetical protein